jgi:hypothetical protein
MESSVKIMLSHDYCHFEVCISKEVESLEEANSLRKNVQRLADEAVRQYKKSKELANKRMILLNEKSTIQKEVNNIICIYPESERTAEHKAKIKALDDDEYWGKYSYDYDDD